MIQFTLNGKVTEYKGDPDRTLLNYLREDKHICSVKDGCSGQAACGACMVEIDGKARLSCTTKMKSLASKTIITTEGIPEPVRDIIANAFVEKGAVQCGFCTPGLITRTKVLFTETPNPSRLEIEKAIKNNLCRCTGYIKIVDAIEEALHKLRRSEQSNLPKSSGKIGTRHPKYQALQLALGKHQFVNDISMDGMLHGALRFSDHPRAKIKSINIEEAKKIDGVIRIFTADDILGNKKTGLIFKDWPLMIGEGELTHYIGDVIAGVVATNREIAREAAALIRIEYEVLPPVTNPVDALTSTCPKVHHGQSNLLDNCVINRGEPDFEYDQSNYKAEGFFQTQRIEHGFLEVESALAFTEGDALRLFSQGQGVYVDQAQIASLLNLPEQKIKITQVATGGGFGGKEDLTVQGHASLFTWTLKKPVKLTLSREESIRMHPKRHPISMKMKVACDNNGNLTALILDAIGDTGAYASVGNKVMERVAGHATGAYHIPNVSVHSKTVYTNNIPCGAMRGFGANQVTFAIESLVDELCEKGNFDRWEFRYHNALKKGSVTATGQILEEGVGVRQTLEAVKDDFYKAKYAGLACGIKNSGVGNGMVDDSHVKVEFLDDGTALISHGWSEMGQGVHTMALQIFCEETGFDPAMVEVKVETRDKLKTGMTTSSRATALVGNAIIDSCKAIKEDLKKLTFDELKGRSYFGKYICDWTTKPGIETDKIITHYAYGYATQLVILNDEGNIEKVVAAHDIGKNLNPTLFEGQIHGAVHMGLGYALTENLPMVDGRLVSDKLRDCGILRAHEMPEVVALAVEVKDPVGPYGAKGIGEIGLVPTAAAVANAFYQYDKVRRYELPLKPIERITIQKKHT
jgi:selenium-dependent xanthine dehydrogenase